VARVLVTGATGRAGRYVVAALLAKGHRVCGTHRTAPGENKQVDWRRVDLTGTNEMSALLGDQEAVIHLAAELSRQALMERVNVDATRQLAALSQISGIRYFGYASSIVVYGSPRTRVVDEATPRLDPSLPMVSQYFAEPYMRDYARTKTAAEIAIEALGPTMRVDFLRPAVVAEDTDLLAAAKWSWLRKIFATYRRTQFITAIDAASAIVHLMECGLAAPQGSRGVIEAYNVVDDTSETYRSLLAKAYRATGDPSFKVLAEVPILVDMAKDYARYRNLTVRYPLGMLRFSGDKLRSTGFVFPVGMEKAIDSAIARFAASQE
jgi:nucleoside-diphosphate-sugar epimerase